MIKCLRRSSLLKRYSFEERENFFEKKLFKNYNNAFLFYKKGATQVNLLKVQEMGERINLIKYNGEFGLLENIYTKYSSLNLNTHSVFHPIEDINKFKRDLLNVDTFRLSNYLIEDPETISVEKNFSDIEFEIYKAYTE